MAYDIQLLVQASVYFLIFILSFVVAIPIGVNVIELNGDCMLYTDIDWDSHTYRASSGSTCYFPVYVAVTFIFYSLALGIYNMYVAFRSKDPHIGYKMWVLPLIVLTAIAMILMFVVSCILSVGIAHTCRGIMKLKDKGVHIEQCSDIQELYGKYDRLDADSFRHFYSYPKTSEEASWITFLAWTVQGCLYVLRYLRNRNCICKRFAPRPSQPAGRQKSQDMSDFASV